MNRLTRRNPGGQADFDAGTRKSSICAALNKADRKLFLAALEKLAAYEDTGLSPEEVQKPSVPEYAFPKNRMALLEADYDTLTDEEKERLARVKAIPEAVVEALDNEYRRLSERVREAESKMDVIADYVNGYDMKGESK